MIGYQDTTDATSRKINVDFSTDKTANQGIPRLGGVQELIQLYRPMGYVQGEEQEQGGTKGRERQKAV